MTDTFRHVSDAAARHAWGGLTPELLERARSRVKVLSSLIDGAMVLDIVADFTAVAFRAILAQSRQATSGEQ